MTEHTFIFAKISPKAEYYDMAKKSIEGILAMTREEPGCLSFTLHEDTKGSLYLYEEWVDDDALEKHYAMDYTQAVFQAYEAWLAETPEITKLAKVA